MRERLNAWAWRLGMLVQGLALGVALAAAVIELATTASGAQIFRYQGF